MPRKPSEEKSPKNKPRVRFIFEPDRTSPNGITYSWLIHGTYNGKEKAATATRAFWLPFAYEATGEYSEDELKELAQQSIWQMEAQIQHLREKFGLGVGPANLASEPLVSSASVAVAEDSRVLRLQWHLLKLGLWLLRILIYWMSLRMFYE
jgi:hypothetical protein